MQTNHMGKDSAFASPQLLKFSSRRFVFNSVCRAGFPSEYVVMGQPRVTESTGRVPGEFLTAPRKPENCTAHTTQPVRAARKAHVQERKRRLIGEMQVHRIARISSGDSPQGTLVDTDTARPAAGGGVSLSSATPDLALAVALTLTCLSAHAGRTSVPRCSFRPRSNRPYFAPFDNKIRASRAS
jgi:hypothetical protein